MQKTLEAVYENGVFRPIERPNGIAEHRQVTLTVTIDSGRESLADVAGCMSADDADDMRAVIEREFESVDPRDWS